MAGGVTQDPRDSLLLSLTPVRDLANSPTKAFLCDPMGHVNQVCEKNNKSPANVATVSFRAGLSAPLAPADEGQEVAESSRSLVEGEKGR